MTEGPPAASVAGAALPLVDRVRRALIAQAATGQPTTYRDLAGRLALLPPLTIHHVTEALETTMREDAAAGRPFIAALCVSKSGTALPGRGFFLVATELGPYMGETSGDDAGRYHALELARALSFYALAARMTADPSDLSEQDKPC